MKSAFVTSYSCARCRSNGRFPIPLIYKEVCLECSYYADVVVADNLILELKAVESIGKIHEAQVLSYMKLLGVKKGLLVNFHAAVHKDGIVRRVL